MSLKTPNEPLSDNLGELVKKPTFTPEKNTKENWVTTKPGIQEDLYSGRKRTVHQPGDPRPV